jgi:hypothetical protein
VRTVRGNAVRLAVFFGPDGLILPGREDRLTARGPKGGIGQDA